VKKIPYLRIGTSYYKKVKAPTIAGLYNEILVSWRIETIRQDHGKDYLSKVPKYDGFTCIPNHIDFKQSYLTFYNTYYPLSKIPKEGDFSNSLHFIKHVFGKQFELGLDYIQLLFTKPIQTLPILCLVWTYYIRLDIKLRDLELHQLTLNYEKKKQELQSII